MSTVRVNKKTFVAPSLFGGFFCARKCKGRLRVHLNTETTIVFPYIVAPGKESVLLDGLNRSGNVSLLHK